MHESSGQDAQFVIGFWETENPFGWLWMHLLIMSAARASYSHKFALDRYLPISKYWTAEMPGRPSYIVYTPAM